MAAKLVGVSEETTTGVKRLYEMTASGTLLFPVSNGAASWCSRRCCCHLLIANSPAPHALRAAIPHPPRPS